MTIYQKCQTAEWHDVGDGRTVKVRATKWKMKTVLIKFYYSRGLIHREFMPPPPRVLLNCSTKRYLIAFWKKFAVCANQENGFSSAWQYSSILIILSIVRSLITSHYKIRTLINLLPCWPDLVSADFLLFFKLKVVLYREVRDVCCIIKISFIWKLVSLIALVP